MKRYAWSKYIDDEIWQGGPCNSIGECVREAADEGYQADETFALGYIENYNVNCTFADDIIERLQNDAYEEVGEVSESWLDCISREDKEKLENRIFNVVSEWLKEIHEEPYFYRVEPFITCTLKEALELNKDKPKGGMVDVI